MEMFGPEFQNFKPEDVDDAPAPPANVKNADAPTPAVDKAKKGKLVAKSTGLKYQFQIMESIGIPRSEIKKFADPLHWLEYFPPIAKVCISEYSIAAIPNKFLDRPITTRLVPESTGDDRSLQQMQILTTTPSSGGKSTNSAV